MKRNRSVPDDVVIPVLTYPDVRAAVAWLTDAFGFRERLRIGEAHRSQMTTADGTGAVIVADAHGERRPPQAGDGVTHSAIVRIDDVKAHYEHARIRGARIVMQPTDFEFGERQYAVEDLAGHQWTFSETLTDVDPAEWGGELI